MEFLKHKSFAQQIRDKEMKLRRVEMKFGKDSLQYKTRAKDLELQKKNYARTYGKTDSNPLAETEVSCG